MEPHIFRSSVRIPRYSLKARLTQHFDGGRVSLRLQVIVSSSVGIMSCILTNMQRMRRDWYVVGVRVITNARGMSADSTLGTAVLLTRMKVKSSMW